MMVDDGDDDHGGDNGEVDDAVLSGQEDIQRPSATISHRLMLLFGLMEEISVVRAVVWKKMKTNSITLVTEVMVVEVLMTRSYQGHDDINRPPRP